MKITVIDYGLSNLLSVRLALAKEGAEVAVTQDPAAVLAASALVLPGVGAFRDGMEGLRRLGLIGPICRRPPQAPRCWASAWACRCCLTNRRSLAFTPAWG